MASGESRPSTCGTRSVGCTAGNEEEQQRKAAWAWKRREGALEGARKGAEEGVLAEHMYRKDVNILWDVLCALEGRPSSEEEVQRIRQGVATRVESRHNMGEMEECLPQEEVSWQRYIQRTRQGRRMGGPPKVEAWAAEGGYKVAVYRETKNGNGYRKLVEYGEGTPLDAGILWTKRGNYAVLWGVRGRRSDAAEVAAAVQGVLDSAQEGQEWPEEMPEGARRQVIPGDGKCLYWALRVVDGAGGQAAAEEVRKALTEGEMARPPESGWARRVMRNAGARTWDQYLDKVRRGEIWGGACEVGRWVQSKGCRVAMYQEWGPRGVYRKMAEVGEGKRTAAVPLWSRRGVGHYELLWPPGEEDAAAVAEADQEDGTESKGDAEVTMEGELAGEGPEKGLGGKSADGGAHVVGCASNTDPGGGGAGGGTRDKRVPGGRGGEWGGGTAQDRKLRAGWEGVLGVQVQEMEYMEVPEGTGKGEWHRRQAGGLDVWVTGGGGGGVAAAAQGGCGVCVGGRESGPHTTGQSGVAGARMEGKVQGGGGGTPVVGLAYDVASRPGGGGPSQE